MEASPFIRQQQPTEQVGTPLHEAQHPLPHREGVLYSEYLLPHYDTAVDTTSVTFGKKQQHEDFGATRSVHLKMDDEATTNYHLLVCETANPKSDIWVVKDTAWSTQPEGLNTDVARKLMKMGFNVLIKGPEIGSSIPLSNSAHNTHAVLNYFENTGLLDASQIAVEGYSRGSMIGFGTNAYASQFNRNVIYSNLTDPCVALPIKANAETVKKAATLPVDLALLGGAVMQGLIDGPRGWHLAKTVNPTPAGLVQFLRTGWPLFNGEAGKMAARTPQEMQATIAFFRRCRVNDEKTYRQILADRPGVRFVQPEGGHGGGIDKRIIGNIAVRFGRIADQLEEGRSPDELDYRYITYGMRAA